MLKPKYLSSLLFFKKTIPLSTYQSSKPSHNHPIFTFSCETIFSSPSSGQSYKYQVTAVSETGEGTGATATLVPSVVPLEPKQPELLDDCTCLGAKSHAKPHAKRGGLVGYSWLPCWICTKQFKFSHTVVSFSPTRTKKIYLMRAEGVGQNTNHIFQQIFGVFLGFAYFHLGSFHVFSASSGLGSPGWRRTAPQRPCAPSHNATSWQRPA